MPAPLVGLACLTPPTREESDAAFNALAVLKQSTKKVGLRRMRRDESAEKATNSSNSPTPHFPQFLRTTPQPALKITGTLARPSATGDALLSPNVKQTPQQGGGDNSDAPKSVALAPLLVFEDRGALGSSAPAAREARDAPQPPLAAADAPQRAPQIAAQNRVSAPAPPQLAQAGVAPAANVSGGLPPLSRLHEEVAAFAAAAWPTRVSFDFSFFFYTRVFLLLHFLNVNSSPFLLSLFRRSRALLPLLSRLSHPS